MGWRRLPTYSMPRGLIVVVGPGSDLLPRMVGQKLAPVWGQQLIVDQRAGGGGTIAQDIAAKSGAKVE